VNDWLNYTVDSGGTQQISNGSKPTAVFLDGVFKTEGDGWSYSETTVTVDGATTLASLYWGTTTSYTTYYFRDDVPTHEQNIGVGDVGTLSTNPPTTNETRSCIIWIQYWFDEDDPIETWNITQITWHVYWKADKANTAIGYQCNGTYGAAMDYNVNLGISSSYVLYESTWNVNIQPSNIANRYYFTLKLASGWALDWGNPFIISGPTCLSYVTFAYTSPSVTSHYYSNFGFYDLNTNDVENKVTWQLYNYSQLLTYTEGQATLLSGTYRLKTYYHVSLINQTDFDTASYGNTTVNIYLQLKAYAYGYLAFSNTVTSLVLNSQSMYNLTFTISGSVPTTMTIGFPQSPTYISKAGVNQTGWTYTSGYVVLTASSLSEWQIIYSPSAPYVPPPSEIQNFLAFLLAGDFLGFIMAVYTQGFGNVDIFFGVVIMLVMVPLYIRTKSLMFMSILWILLGSLFLVAMPLVSGLAVLLLVLGVGSMLFEIFMINRRG
jgi:hypothetical protein